MTKLWFISACLVVANLMASERAQAPSGFHWVTYKDLYCEIQVPDGWVQDSPDAGITNVIRISPVPIPRKQGIETGFTMNVIRCRRQKDWKDGMQLVGQVMEEARQATEHPIQSTIKNENDALVMIVEGERFIPTAPHPEKKYHVRMIARAFGKLATIYVYSFGAPVDEWDEAWKKGKVMLSPIQFHIPIPGEGQPNHAPQSTPPSVTPPAGQEARQP